jgi:hypothetical protein
VEGFGREDIPGWDLVVCTLGRSLKDVRGNPTRACGSKASHLVRLVLKSIASYATITWADVAHLPLYDLQTHGIQNGREHSTKHLSMFLCIAMQLASPCPR